MTLFELTENVRVRRTGADRYVRISDLLAVRRYAPQSPDETRDMRISAFTEPECPLRLYWRAGVGRLCYPKRRFAEGQNPRK